MVAEKPMTCVIDLIDYGLKREPSRLCLRDRFQSYTHAEVERVLGRKTKGGVFKKVGKDILMFDAKSGDYVPGKAKAAPEVDKILKKKELGERFKAHFGTDIVDGIGSTEMLHIFLSNRPGQLRYGTTGWPVPGWTRWRTLRSIPIPIPRGSIPIAAPRTP